MKKFIISACLTLATIFIPGQNVALADSFWTETVSPSGGYLEFTQDENPFDFFALEFQQPISFEVKRNSTWETININDEQDPNSRMSELVEWPRQEPLLIRFPGLAPKTVTAHFTKTESLAYQAGPVLVTSAMIEDLPIISRSAWGADESWRYREEAERLPPDQTKIEEKNSGQGLSTREQKCNQSQEVYPDEFEVNKVVAYENDQRLRWPFQYSKAIRKVVIHHTAETGVMNGRAADEVMRAIYRYHTVSRGWGDIGYHYVVAPDGTIFEGRAGGDKVIGGHVYCNNIGTIGIALMGNFNDYEPSDKQLEALGRILPRLAKKYELDLTATDWFHGKNTANLLGHRDLGATACPGENMYTLLPLIRKALNGSAEILFARSQQSDGKPVDRLEVLNMKPGEKKEIQLSFENTGNATWPASTWLFATIGEGVKVQSVSREKEYVAAKLKEREVKPGQTGHFTVRLESGYKGGLSTISFVPVVRDKRLNNAETLQLIEVDKPEWGMKLDQIRMRPETPVTGKSTSVSIDMLNTGDAKWSKSKLKLVVSIPDERKEFNLKLKDDVRGGQSGTFTGRMPALYKPGEKLLIMDLYLNGERLPVRVMENILVKQSNNLAHTDNLREKLVMAEKGKEFSRSVEFKNIGNNEWYQEDLVLQAQLRREKLLFHPNQETIAPGETATFDLDIPVQKGIQPYILSLKDERQRLFLKVLLLRGVNKLPGGKSQVISTTPKNQVKPKQIDDQLIRIKLSYPTGTDTVTVLGEGKYDLTDGEGNLLFPGRENQDVFIERVGPAVKFREKIVKVIRAVPHQQDTIMQVKNWNRIPAWDSKGTWNDNRFPGVLEIRIDGGELIVINELPLGSYLMGIAETLESDHPEKKKAIALVARSYAAFYLDPQNRKYPGKPYDGSDDPAEFQKYLGASFTDRGAGWKQAVAATVNEVITFNEDIIKTPFHTCSGGKTVSAQEKWGWTNTPYLPSVDDPGCAHKPRLGHGVGMSGGGAQYFASNGDSYRQILQYFYPGTAVTKL